jgi:hypothetical protein
MDEVAEMLSSIQQQMQLLNPPKEAGEGLQLDFTAAAEEYPLSRESISHSGFWHGHGGSGYGERSRCVWITGGYQDVCWCVIGVAFSAELMRLLLWFYWKR